jgi:diadenosine tetraphosphate (Ap4A) HIT family hydrolase
MTTECGICRTDRPAAPGGVIHADGTWRVEHIAAPIPLLGWLVIAPSRHVTTFADLTSDEAARFGVLAQHVSQALTAALHPTRVYVALFGEGEGFEHIHFHVVPRPPDLPAEFRGPKVFGLWAKAQADGDQAPLSEVQALADRLRKALW